eukprot:55649-Prorocentrum_minimum.AAC.1
MYNRGVLAHHAELGRGQGYGAHHHSVQRHAPGQIRPIRHRACVANPPPPDQTRLAGPTVQARPIETRPIFFESVRGRTLSADRTCLSDRPAPNAARVTKSVTLRLDCEHCYGHGEKLN